jgi:hypothetical protein
LLLGGVLLSTIAFLDYVFVYDAMRQEQAALDRQWSETVQRSRQIDPRALPAGRPAPATLRGVPTVTGTAAAGFLLCVGGVVRLLREMRRRSRANSV